MYAEAGYATLELQSALDTNHLWFFGCSEECNACSLFLQCLLAKVHSYIFVWKPLSELWDIFLHNFPAVFYASGYLVFVDNDVSDKSVTGRNEHIWSLSGLAPWRWWHDIWGMYMYSLVLYYLRPQKRCNSGFRLSQTSLSSTKFIEKVISIWL